MVALPALIVMPVGVVTSQRVVETVPCKDHVVEPRVRDRVLELLEKKDTPEDAPTACPFVLNAPLVRVIPVPVLAMGFRASCKVQPPPTPSKVIGPRRYAADVIVCPVEVEVNFIREVADGANVIPAARAKFPDMFIPLPVAMRIVPAPGEVMVKL